MTFQCKNVLKLLTSKTIELLHLGNIRLSLQYNPSFLKGDKWVDIHQINLNQSFFFLHATSVSKPVDNL